MTHRAQQIIEAAVTAIQAQSNLPVNASNVYKNRSLTLGDENGELNAISVNLGDDQSFSELGTDNLSFIDSLLTLSVLHYAQEDTEDLAIIALLDQRRRVHQALMAFDTLGLDFVVGLRYGGAATPELDSTTQRIAARMESRWLVHYRMSFADPGA